MRVEKIEETSVNVLVRIEHDDGTFDVENISLSSERNRLAYKHGLFSCIIEREEILSYSHEDMTLHVVPSEHGFTIQTSEEDLPAMPVAPEHRNRFYDVLLTAEKDGDTSELWAFYDEMMSGDVRSPVMAYIASEPPFHDHVEARALGWLIYGHLRLTYDCEFYHPDTDSKVLSGGVSDSSSANIAYDVTPPELPDDHQRKVEIRGAEYTLTEPELDFLALAIWAVAYAPQENPAPDTVNTEWYGELIDPDADTGQATLTPPPDSDSR